MAPTELVEKPKNADRSARRREKSRDAARCRRQQESDTFNEICNVIPVPSKILAQMDRSMIMRLMISFMKFRNLLNTENATHLQDCKKNTSETETSYDEEYIDTLNGFVIVLSHDCDILYVSDNVKHHIGVGSLELMGQNLFCYTHEGDHLEITNSMKESTDVKTPRSFFMRMKSTLTSAGKNVNLKSALYKVLKCEGIVHQSHDGNPRYMVAYCEPIPHPANIEMVLDCNTFLSQHSLNMHFTYCDEDRVHELLMYCEDDMIGQSFFDFCHTDDIKSLEESFKTLYRLGQITTSRYRMLVKSGGYVWVVSQATVINNPRNQQPSNIVCIHYVISGVTEEKCVLSLAQLKYVEENENMPKLEEISDDQLEVVDCNDEIFDSTICDSTSSIFVGSNKSTDDLFDSTSSIFHPTTEALEALAKNAPSIGDEIKFKDFNFDDCTVIDEEMCRNAPCIGDPMWDCTFLSSKDTKQFVEGDTASEMEQLLCGILPDENYPPQVKAGSVLVGNQPLTTITAVPDAGTVLATRMKRKLPRDLQIITIPKTQYQRHVQPALAHTEKCGTFKYDPPENVKTSSFSNPPTKRQKRQSNVDSSYGEGWDCGEKNRYEYEDGCDRIGDTPSPIFKRENRSWLPVLSLHDCEINAPVEDGVSALEWMTLSDVLSAA